MMLSTLLLPRGGVMKSQVGYTTIRLVRDNDCIKTIKIQEHHNNQVTQAIRDASLDYSSISRPLQTDKRRVHKLHYIDTAFIKYQSNVPQQTV